MVLLVATGYAGGVGDKIPQAASTGLGTNAITLTKTTRVIKNTFMMNCFLQKENTGLNYFMVTEDSVKKLKDSTHLFVLSYFKKISSHLLQFL